MASLVEKIIEAEIFLKNKWEKIKEQRLWKRIKRPKIIKIDESLLELENKIIEEIEKERNKEKEDIKKKIKIIEEKLKRLPDVGIGKVSASKITTYKGCPMAYFYSYVAGIEPIEYPWYIAFGEVLHSVLRDFNLGLLRNVDEMINGREVFIFEKNKIKKKKILGLKARWVRKAHSKNIKFPYKEKKYELYYTGERIIRRVFEQEKNKEKPFLVEKKFDVVLRYNDGGEKLVYEVTGIFDKVDMINKDGQTKIIITDYKTSRLDEKEINIKLGFQFTEYFFSYLELAEQKSYEFPKPIPEKNLEIVVHGLINDVKVKTKRNEADLKYMMRTIKEVDENIRKCNFTPFIGKHCKVMDCIWKHLCYEIFFKKGRKNLIKVMDYKAEKQQSLF